MHLGASPVPRDISGLPIHGQGSLQFGVGHRNPALSGERCGQGEAGAGYRLAGARLCAAVEAQRGALRLQPGNTPQREGAVRVQRLHRPRHVGAHVKVYLGGAKGHLTYLSLSVFWRVMRRPRAAAQAKTRKDRILWCTVG